LASANPDARAKRKIVDVVTIKHHGEQLLVPDGMSIDRAIAVLQRRKVEDEMEVGVNHTFDTFPWDGARALMRALGRKFGWADYSSATIDGFFGPIKQNVQFIDVEVGYKKHERVAWGRVLLPGVEGELHTSMTTIRDGAVNRAAFALTGTVKRKHEHIVAELAEEVRRVLAEESIYRGKAIRIRFRDDQGQQFVDPWSGNPLPLEPKFLNLTTVREQDMVFSFRVEGAIKTNIFAPIEYAEQARKAGIPLKRGVLLAGQFGVGKTLAAYVTAKKAEENGWTFLYVETPTELSEAIRFAQMYAPAVVFCEDIDRIYDKLEGQKRDAQTDALLNIIDGIDSKAGEVMVVLTTNNVEGIHQALLRPGRLDAVVNVEPPDAEAVERLIHVYGRGLVPQDEDLGMVGDLLAGAIPAVIREAVERAKLSAIRLNPGHDLVVTGAALLDAATSMQMQLELLRPKAVDHRSDIEKAAAILGSAITKGVNDETQRSLRDEAYLLTH
jgi:transitional endoplasmic reticulum ATPase